MSKTEETPDGVISEAEAAKKGPIDGEKISNANAAAHRKQKYGGADTPVIDEAEAAKEPADAAEKRSNELAARLRSEKYPDPFEAHITTEAEVVAKEKGAGNLDPDAKAPAERKRTTQENKPRNTRSK